MYDEIYLGIDIGGTDVKMGIMNKNGELLASDTATVNFDMYETPILRTVKRASAAFLGKYSEYENKIKAIGVSATGQIDSRAGVVTGTAGHIKNWQGSRIKEELEEQFHLPVAVANDANCAALGEYWIGAAKGVEDVIVITVGTGIGGGIITGGRLLSGARGIAGELGHFSIQSGGVECTCGNRGCYERYASTTALVKMISEKQKIGELKAFTDEISGKTIFEELGKGNAKLQAFVDEWIDYVSAGLVSLVHIFNPSLIIISGGVSMQKEHFIEPLAAKVKARIMPAYRKDLEIRQAELKNNAGLAGAIYNCICTHN
ncbi:MAG: ROK family protein [Clostridiales bacterium]|nr:ROK family protein [Clostridiales bacterium]